MLSRHLTLTGEDEARAVLMCSAKHRTTSRLVPTPHPQTSLPLTVWHTPSIIPSLPSPPPPLAAHTPSPRHADVNFTANPAKYIKYTVQDVVSIIDDDLFETKAVSMNKLSLRKEKLDAIS